jgi:tRNA uridine 5-carbamoylmethylation protein Kti12
MNSYEYDVNLAKPGKKENALILVRGCPGYGKSTYSKFLVDSISRIKKSVLLETDLYFSAHGEYRFDRDRLGEAHRWTVTTTEILLSSGVEVVVANTFTRWREMLQYVDYAVKFSHPIWVYTMKKEYGSIHSVPQDTLTHMKNRFRPHEYILEKINEY